MLYIVALWVALTACGTTPQPTAPETAKTPLPPKQYLIDGKLAGLIESSFIRFGYATPDGYPSQATEKTPTNSLDRLMTTPRQLDGPLVVQADSLSPEELALRVDQRAILRTDAAYRAGQPLNILPSKLTSLAKPEGTDPSSNAVDQEYGYLNTGTFTAAYIEESAQGKTVVIVTADATAATEKDTGHRDGQFYSNRGVTRYERAVEPSLTSGEGPIRRIFWSARTLQTDCQSDGLDPSSFSAGCALVRMGDNIYYAGHQNVILVSPVRTLEFQYFYHGQGGEVHASNILQFVTPISADGSRYATALDDSSYPYSMPEPETPATGTFAVLLKGGTPVDGNTVAGWPAFSVLDK